METSRRAAVVVLMLASSGFAYAFGRQQGGMEAREESKIRLEASTPFPDALMYGADDDAPGEGVDATAGERDDGAAGAVSSARGVPLDDGRD